MSIYNRRIACITGGTGFRSVAKALASLYPNPTTVHVIGTADSGRSTRRIREFFGIPAIGDLRSRCIDLADRRTLGYREITDLLAYRLPNIENKTALEDEFAAIIKGHHPLTHAASAGNHKFTRIILANLKRFDEERKTIELTKGSFDLKQGSIGNFFLTGAYLDFGDISAALFLYEQLAGVRGHVLPASEEIMHLAAEKVDGQVITGQHLITKTDLGLQLKRLFFLEQEDPQASEIKPRLSAEAAEAIKSSDLIVFSMGSFYTSLLSTLHLMGMSEAVRASHALKVFIPNTIEDPEIRGMTTADMVKRLIETLKGNDPVAREPDYLHVVITGDRGKSLSLGTGRRLIPDDTKSLLGFGIEKTPLITEGELTGYYQPEPLADLLARLNYKPSGCP
ncbi:MAG: YvcK family protein [Candidatus Margulisbacteria bacterium]|nr:YvcK family protein [Candidatus Margulisiibacteriota bacterium]MBU1617084.1 YvcK family protein [Candidatus Margulisiibacteriota bacterium]MBU1867734.1 YvcK family protein [Candidatus Margulisiibacteriota bacterium]